MSLSPETLQEEGEEERLLRENRTGELGSGLTVLCYPSPATEEQRALGYITDPLILQQQSRVVCLTKPYAVCPSCPHSRFTLFFEEGYKQRRLELVACPKWQDPQDRTRGHSPDGYVMTEVATCEKKPFDFCPSCPKPEALVQLGVSKGTEGWYGRWNRLQKELYE